MGCRDDAVYAEKRWRWLRSALLMVVKPMVMPVTESRREEEKLVMVKIETCWDRDRGEARKEKWANFTVKDEEMVRKWPSLAIL